ncbi:MAG: threonine--tRNA ligase [Candidatus Paceibacterota bacterium]|jgi:threonyl-tRNA synthetase
MAKESNLDAKRHSLSHLMAMAVLEMYPKTKLGIGPTIENGFYYDFDLPGGNGRKIAEEDLPKIEKRVKELIKSKLDFQKKIITAAEAKKLFKDQSYKLELIKELQKTKEKISVYETGSFVDLCAGPHIKNTSEIDPESFKFTKLAGAYWKGSEKNKMLTRIYGIAFENKQQLDEYLRILEESEKRNHVLLGQKLGLFMISEEVGQGLPLWLPKGALLRQILEDFIIQKYLKNGYDLVRTPHIGSEKLFSISGHLTNYKEGMYSPLEVEKEKYYLKPMNCPMHLMIYKNSPKSYRDLPIRYAELGTVYRYEKSGVLHGLTRVRGFTQDDGHIICRKDQLEEEIEKAIKLTKDVLETFGFKDFRVALSVRDPKNKKKYLGSDELWKESENMLAKGIKKAGWDFEIEEGEAVFYGPKMDIKVKDSLGREWQISTLQVDFNLPERFDIDFINEKSQKERPFMLHRALLGSLERFIGVLIEHYAGAFPVWLSPIQISIITVNESHKNYAQEVFSLLNENGIRATLDEDNQTVGKKVREAKINKIPYIVVIGDKEIAAKNINITNTRTEKSETKTPEEFIKDILEEIEEKK